MTKDRLRLRGLRRCSLSLLSLVSAAFLIYLYRFGILNALIMVAIILLITFGLVAYFRGCSDLCVSRGWGKDIVYAGVSLFLFSIPVGLWLLPYGFCLTAFSFVSAFALPWMLPRRRVFHGRRLS